MARLPCASLDSPLDSKAPHLYRAALQLPHTGRVHSGQQDAAIASAAPTLPSIPSAAAMWNGLTPGPVLCCAVSVLASDGDKVQKGQEFGSISGSARSILVAERICLNFMQRMSGIATATAAMVAAAAVHKAK